MPTDRGYDAAKLVTVTKDELSDDLSESGLNFNVDEIYQRLFVWRQESVSIPYWLIKLL